MVNVDKPFTDLSVGFFKVEITNDTGRSMCFYAEPSGGRASLVTVYRDFCFRSFKSGFRFSDLFRRKGMFGAFNGLKVMKPCFPNSFCV